VLIGVSAGAGSTAAGHQTASNSAGTAGTPGTAGSADAYAYAYADADDPGGRWRVVPRGIGLRVGRLRRARVR
jgi:hypothetical protein